MTTCKESFLPLHRQPAYCLLMMISFSPTERKPSKTADNRKIEPEIIPPACIIDLIYTDSILEKPKNQRDRRNPAMPDPPEETCW